MSQGNSTLLQLGSRPTGASQQPSRIGLIELPGVGLLDQDGENWNLFYNGRTLVSKMFLIPQLQAGGFEVNLVNLKLGTGERRYGSTRWKNGTLHKILRGDLIEEIDPDSNDAWGITVNFMVEREPALMAIKHLSRAGKPVVVGGSDALARPQPYLQAGATAVVQDKSGAANWAIMDHVLGRAPRAPLTGVIFRDGSVHARRKPPMNPQEWPIPTTQVIHQCMGNQYVLNGLTESLYPIGAIYPDIGCDRHCDFCLTPTYALGYRKAGIERIFEWAQAMKDAGANSYGIWSDQFLARINWKTGRDEILAIMKGLRGIGVPHLWGNGIELRKITKGRGFNRAGSDMSVDEELVEVLFGWDGKRGCGEAYIPAERPSAIRQDYAKLLPWQEHCDMMRAIVRSGVPMINYGVIIGLPDDDDESMLWLEEAVGELYHELIDINPKLTFKLSPLPISPLPGTPLEEKIREQGLLRFEEPELVGCFRIATADTHHMDYAQVSNWQLRLKKVTNTTLYQPASSLGKAGLHFTANAGTSEAGTDSEVPLRG